MVNRINTYTGAVSFNKTYKYYKEVYIKQDLKGYIIYKSLECYFKSVHGIYIPIKNWLKIQRLLREGK